jgi:hypothetical protein
MNNTLNELDMPILRGPRMMYSLPPEEVVRFAIANVGKSFQQLTIDEKLKLAEIAKCRYCCELYLEAKAAALHKQVVYVHKGRPVGPVHDESKPEQSKESKEDEFGKQIDVDKPRNQS